MEKNGASMKVEDDDAADAAVDSTDATNGTLSGGMKDEPEFPEDDFGEGEEYEEEGDYGEEEAYEGEEEGGEYGANEHGGEFEISAENGDFGENVEDQGEDMLEDVKLKIREMEEEAEKLRQLQSESDKPNSRASVGSTTGLPSSTAPSESEKAEVDARSVYVGQVDYNCTIEELDAHFRPCGPINRVTIMCHRHNGAPKGFAYIEFTNKESVDAAVSMNDSILRDRQLKVVAKRTNIPGMGSVTRRPTRFYRGAGFQRGRRPYYRPYNPAYRGRSSYRGGYRGGSGYRRPRASRGYPVY